MVNSRKAALDVLLKIEQDGSYSNIALNNAIKSYALRGVDASFASALVYGVLERQITLDYIIKQYSKIPLKKIETRTKVILRLGILQLLFMDKIPESAAVNESVNLAKKCGLRKSSGFINAVLRSITRAKVKYTLPDKNDMFFRYSVKYSVPFELVKLWIDSYGEENTVRLLESLSGRPKICVRVNTLKTNKKELTDEFSAENVQTSELLLLKDALYVENTGSIERLNAYKEGRFYIQDASSQFCVDLLSPKPGDTVIDICSAPGGKALTSAQYMNDKGRIFACDIYEHKLRLIESNAKRLGISSITAVLRDGEKDDESLPRADKVICDVPCSGLGILGRKPEIRYKKDLINKQLPEIQYRILRKSAALLSDGGRLVYSTCTLNPAENNLNAARFLEEHPDFYGIKICLPPGIKRAVKENDYEITLMPHTAGTDGFYIAVFGKRG